MAETIDIEAPGTDKADLAAAIAQLRPPRQAMTAFVAGNSIAAAMKYSAGFTPRNSVLWADFIDGNPLQFKRMTASTRADLYCIYGYSSQTLPTILGDLEAQLFTPMAAAGIVPDIGIFPALLENDLFASRTVAQMQASITELIRNVQARFPGIIILLCTPHLNGNRTGGSVYIQADFLAITAWMLTLDNSVDIFVTDLSQAYPDATNPEKAEVQAFTASFSGTTMTVTDAGDAAIGMRMAISGAGITTGTVITAFGTGTGGTGTYTVSNSHTLSAQSVTLHPWTDDSVHPNARASHVIGRLIADTFDRISPRWKRPARHLSTNPALGGTTSATATGITGTRPTGTFFTTPSGCNIVSTAEQPGWLIEVQGISSSTTAVNGGCAGIALTGALELETFVEFEIVEGAENLRLLQVNSRINDGSGNTYQYWMKSSSPETDAIYENGDIISFRSGPFVATSGFITQVTNYFEMAFRSLQEGTDNVKIRIRKEGVAITKEHPIVNIAAATHTVLAQDNGKQHSLNRAAGITVTLPAATGSGLRIPFVVSAVPSGGSSIIKVANASDTIDGLLPVLDNDGTALTAYAATGTDDTLTLNGTTTGGQLGDQFELVDSAPNQWTIKGSLVVPIGSNPADPFSATV